MGSLRKLFVLVAICMIALISPSCGGHAAQGALQDASKATVPNTQQQANKTDENPKVEIVCGKASDGWLERISESLPAIIAFLGVAFGLYQFKSTKTEELKKTYWQEQKLLYEEASDNAASIAIADLLAQVADERKAFKRLYWGRMCLLESPEVAGAMQAFFNSLGQWESSKPERKPDNMEDLSADLAHTMRDSLFDTWSRVKIGSLPGKDSESGPKPNNSHKIG